MILDDILAARRLDVAAAKRRTPVRELETWPLYGEPRRGFSAALRGAAPTIIADVKKASPSRGVIRADFEPIAIARAYAAGGAAALSVLTEERFFQGRPEYLAEIRAAVALPLLRKDFLFDPYQLVEARAWGADAALLIVAALEPGQLAELLATATELGLDALTEAHSEGEVEIAAGAGARIIGINNRDLRTFVTTLDTAVRLRPRIPPGSTAVAESGIETAADVARLCSCGYDALLVGESLMRAPDPAAALRALRAGGGGA
jgi:indole-3-glycerol phosphate synthase